MLQKYLLVGMEESSKTPMTICPYVKERCCTIADEIKISKLFKEVTFPIMTQHSDKTISLLARMIIMVDDLRRMDPVDMSLRYIKRREIPYK